jgi:hypothetical protein
MVNRDRITITKRVSKRPNIQSLASIENVTRLELRPTAMAILPTTVKPLRYGKRRNDMDIPGIR